MNENEKLLLETYEKLKLYFEPVAKQPLKSWKPKECEKYLFVNAEGYCLEDVWVDGNIDKHRHAIGNCYPCTDEGKELTIWEQITRRKYERALWEAADWVEGNYYFGAYSLSSKEIIGMKFAYPLKNCDTPTCLFPKVISNLPRFATLESTIDAHTRILGDDAERYFRVR